MSCHRSLRWLITAVLVVTAANTLSADAQAGRLVFQATVIEGEVQKPEVAVYVTRQNLNDRYQLELKESFVPKILDSVRHAPF